MLPFAVFFAVVRLGPLFSDGAVLQREVPVPVWGMAEAGHTVTVTLGDVRAETKAGADGRWLVRLPKMPASKTPCSLVAVSGESRTVARDVLVGEVWFAGGQSNMDVGLVGDEVHYRDCQGAAFSRLTHLPHVRWADHRNEWRPFTPPNLTNRHVSAVAFYFARELSTALEVPIGLVCRYTGGLNIEQWISRRGYELNGRLPQFLNWKRIQKADWNKSVHARGAVAHWSKQPMMLDEKWIKPIEPFRCRGVIWYQGEQNASYGETDYDVKLDALLRGFEIAFDNPQLKFYMVQIPPPCAGCGFPEAQQRFVDQHREDGRVRMAVINDVITLGDVHCPDKEPVGRRLAYLALRHDYGCDALTADSPVAVSCRAEGVRMHVKVEHGDGLYVYNAPASYDSTFELAGADGVFRRAEIVNRRAFKDWSGKLKFDGGIQPNEIVLESKEVPDPVSVRYMYCKPKVGNVFNGGNLPLGAFSHSVTGADPAVPAVPFRCPAQDAHDADRQKAVGL